MDCGSTSWAGRTRRAWETRPTFPGTAWTRSGSARTARVARRSEAEFWSALFIGFAVAVRGAGLSSNDLTAGDVLAGFGFGFFIGGVLGALAGSTRHQWEQVYP